MKPQPRPQVFGRASWKPFDRLQCPGRQNQKEKAEKGKQLERWGCDPLVLLRRLVELYPLCGPQHPELVCPVDGLQDADRGQTWTTP